MPQAFNTTNLLDMRIKRTKTGSIGGGFSFSLVQRRRSHGGVNKRYNTTSIFTSTIDGMVSHDWDET
jgi:hypothetical protein